MADLSSPPHIRVPSSHHAPVAVASAVLHLRPADIDARNATFTMPRAVALIERRQGRHIVRSTAQWPARTGGGLLLVARSPARR